MKYLININRILSINEADIFLMKNFKKKTIIFLKIKYLFANDIY